MSGKLEILRKKIPQLTYEQKAIIELVDENKYFKEKLEKAFKRLDILEHELRYVKNRGYDHA